MASSVHLRAEGYVPIPVMGLASLAGLVFTTGSVILLQAIQGANQLTFGQLLTLGGVLGGIPTTVTLWVIHVLYDLRAKVAKLEGMPERLGKLEKRLDGHVDQEG